MRLTVGSRFSADKQDAETSPSGLPSAYLGRPARVADDGWACILLGRVTVGVGFGWNVEEMSHHGVDPSRRRTRMREHVLAMQALWAEEVALFAGEWVNFAPSWSWPKPAQRPLPVLIGGAATPTTFRHLAEYAHGWLPLGRKALREGLPVLRSQLARAGRDPDAIEVVCLLGAGVDAAVLESARQLGATSVLVDVLPEPRDDVLRALDALSAQVRRWGA
jgi:alkanesulfonate monooxygenase SsuD/methylene tetrahydromethanopterin reductase-like flavin-dependent oxidoreductase (luciferase family)